MSRSTLATSVSLPAELVDIIAFHLRPEDSEWESLRWTELMSASRGIGSLHSCSLVCRQWRAGTLPHLFRSVRYSFRRERDGDDVLQDQDFAKDPVRYKTLSMFSDFLLDNPAVSVWIKRLRLVYWPFSWTVDTDPGDYPNVCPEDMLDPQPLISLLQLLPRLDELHLESVLLRDVTMPQAVAYKPLKRLSLSPSLNFCSNAGTASTSTGAAVVAPLQLFSSVKVLRLKGLAFGGGVAGMVFANHLEVDALELEGRVEGIGAVSSALARPNLATTIHSLLMYDLRLAASRIVEHNSELDQLLAAIGPALRTVTYLGINFNPLKGTLIVPRLSSCTGLSSLCIGAEVKGRHAPWIIHRILDLLRIPAVAPLKQLELRLEFCNVSSTSSLRNGFRPLDSTLVSLAQTHGMHSIIVECFKEQSWPLRDVSHEALIRDILPRLDALGKLWVRVKDTEG